MSNIAVVYYSATGHVYNLADALAQGARDAGADVRLRRVPEVAGEEVIRQQDAWHEHYVTTMDSVEEASLDDLEWADGLALGTPTRYGLPAAQLKQFIDQTGPLWRRGRLANKVATSFTSSENLHGGQESTLLALNNVFYHWGSLIVPPGYTNAVQYAAGGNPYGTSYPAGRDADPSVTAEALTAAHYQGYRLAQFAGLLVARGADSSGDRESIRAAQGDRSPTTAPEGGPFTGRGDARSDPLGLDPYSPPPPSRWAGQARSASP
jgi:NAD(P)H dehydrogenase (quinone)